MAELMTKIGPFVKAERKKDQRWRLVCVFWRLWPVYLTIALIEGLSLWLWGGHSNFLTSSALLILFAVISYLSFRHGLRVAILSAFISTLYLAILGHMEADEIFRIYYPDDWVRLLIIIGSVFFTAAFVIGKMRDKVDALMEDANLGRLIAEKESSLLNAIVKEMPDGVVVVKVPSGSAIIVNDQVKRIWRAEKGGLKLRHVDDLRGFSAFHSDGKKYKLDDWPICRSLRSGETVREEEMIIKRFDNSHGVLSVSSCPIKNEVGKIVSALSTFTDISEKVEDERRKDEFIGMASHELKTPITSMKIFTQVLNNRLKAGLSASEVLPLVEKIELQIDKLNRLVVTLLDISRIQSDKVILEKTVFLIDDLIKEVVTNIGLSVTTHRLLIKNTTGAKVFADKDRIEQVLINLLINAVKYSEKANLVVIHSVLEPSKVSVSVQDFGIGVKREHHKRIFEQFYQATGSSKKAFPGLGMGLFISHEIIKRHNGRLALESEPGKGSVFTFSLPLADESLEPSPVDEKNNDEVDGDPGVINKD
jgi:signal transduction histidine kinase